MTSRNRTDAELLAAWSRGDDRSGSVLVERHFSAVHGFLHDKVQAGAVDDLVQRTFIACMEQRDRFRGAASVRRWLLAIARNQLYSHWRSLDAARRATKRLEEYTIEALLPTPTGVVARHEQQRVLVRALRRIPVDLQLMLELLYWEELSYAELSEVLDLPLGTVKSRLNGPGSCCSRRCGPSVLPSTSPRAPPSSSRTGSDRWIATRPDGRDAGGR